MTAISIGDALGSGFGLIRRRPLTVVIWGVLSSGVSIAGLALLWPFYRLMATRFGQQGTAAKFDFTQFHQMMALQSLSMFVNLLSACAGVVLFCAIWRAILRPDESRFAYLRLGATEVFVFLFVAVAYIFWLMAVFVIGMPLVLLAVFLGFEHAATAAVLVGLAAGAVILGGSLFVFLRFCLGGPLILDQGKLLLFDSWTLTRGSTDRLLGLSLCLFVVTVVLEIVIGALLLTSAAAFFSALPGGLTGFLNALHQSPDTALASVAPFLIVIALIGTPIAGALQTIIAAPWASAYRDLTAETATDLVG